MRIAILGGTRFVGRHIVDALQGSGHELLLFNRGETNREIFPAARRVRLDRDGDLAALTDARPDIVIDTSGYAPEQVRRSAQACEASISRYVFVSTIDVYDLAQPQIDESSATKPFGPSTSRTQGDTEVYGEQKAECERELLRIVGEERALILRPGLIAGPFDYTDRFTYWPVRIARSGRVIAPRSAAMRLQLIDARDLAKLVWKSIDGWVAGTYNVVGSPSAIKMGDLLSACSRIAGTSPHLEWASDAFLLEHGVGPWVELPLWVPESMRELRGSTNISNERALAAGLSLRPLEETIHDVLAEYRSRADGALRAGLSAEREGALLGAFNASRKRAR